MSIRDDLRAVISRLNDDRFRIISLLTLNGLYFIPDRCELINIAKYVLDPPILLRFNLPTPVLQIKTPKSTYGYCLVVWGDDTRSISTGEISHLYANDAAGLHTISITGEVTQTFNTEDAFQGLEYLTRVIVNSPIILGTNAFKNCIRLTQVNLNNNVADISDSAFEGCTALSMIGFTSGITRIGNSAFKGCTGLTSLDLTACTGLLSIGESAFEGCTGLTSVKLPNSVKTIGANAFKGCNNISVVQLGTGVETVGANAFYGINSSNTGNTASISLPASITSIGTGAFDCGFRKFYINWSDPSSVAVEANAFSSPSWNNGKVVVPSGSLDNYVYRLNNKQHLQPTAANYPTTNSFTYRDYDF